jgi:tRNA (adenine37-N6)-methyltransferase
MTDDAKSSVLRPIGYVRSPHRERSDVPKGFGAQHSAEGTIEILPEFAAGLLDIEGFSHLYVHWIFDRSQGFDLLAQPPTADRPHGVFATRAPRRPNPLALTVVELLSRDGPRLYVRGVDMLDGTPVVDLKPVLSGIAASDLRRGWLDQAEERHAAGTDAKSPATRGSGGCPAATASSGSTPGGPIRWRMHLPVPPAEVFAALNSNAGRGSFWAESAVEIDGCIEFRFIDGQTYSARVLERREPRRLVLEYFASRVVFELESDGQGGTDLYLENTGVGAAEWHEVHAGWLNVLFPLKAVLGFGGDLRNHDARRTWAKGYADQ